MKKLISLALLLVMALSITSCQNDAKSSESPSQAASSSGSEGNMEKTSVKIKSKNAAGEDIQLEVPYNPKRIAVMDFAALDILDNLKMEERIVGVSKGSRIDYLQNYMTNDKITNLGTIKEASLESVMACEPDVIFIGGRLASQYDALSEIAPVVYLATDSSIGVVKSTEKNATTIASLFGKEDEIVALMDGYESRIEKLSEVAKGKTALVGMVTSGSFNILGNNGRCSIIGVEVGFDNIGLEEATKAAERKKEPAISSATESVLPQGNTTATHGNEASFEVLVKLNPDYVFAMDRDAAIGTEGAKMAKEIMENELVMQTNAYKNGHIVYLEHPAVWYTAEGGITAMDIMLSDLETALLQ